MSTGRLSRTSFAPRACLVRTLSLHVLAAASSLFAACGSDDPALLPGASTGSGAGGISTVTGGATNGGEATTGARGDGGRSASDGGGDAASDSREGGATGGVSATSSSSSTGAAPDGGVGREGGGTSTGSTAADASSSSGGSSSLCGNGTVNPGETCDDGNTRDFDGCSSSCTDSHACEACEADACPRLLTGCDSLAAAADKAACRAVYACAIRTGCWIDDGTQTKCFCGTASMSDCRTGMIGDGACRSEIIAGLPNVDPADLYNALNNATKPTGAAVTLLNCDEMLCPDDCLRHGTTGGNTGGTTTLTGGSTSSAATSNTTGATTGSPTGGSTGASTGTTGTLDAGVTSPRDAGDGGDGGTTGGTSGSDGGGADAGAAFACPVGTPNAGFITAPGPLASSMDCRTCESDACPSKVNACASSSDPATCNSLIDCMRRTNCAAISYTDCYCGTTLLADCKAGNSPNGVCAALMIQGLPGVAPADRFNGLNNETKPTGAAVSLIFCDQQLCVDSDSNNICLPYCGMP